VKPNCHYLRWSYSQKYLKYPPIILDLKTFLESTKLVTEHFQHKGKVLAQFLEHLPTKCEALWSNTSTTKKLSKNKFK
jgi:hypothetical protein